MTFRIEIPLRIQSCANLREHWSVTAKRAKIHRAAAVVVPLGLPLPCVVRLTRVGPRLLDTDNLAGGFKALRDGIATRLGVDDADPQVVWEYAQRKGGRGQFAAVIEVLDTVNQSGSLGAGRPH